MKSSKLKKIFEHKGSDYIVSAALIIEDIELGFNIISKELSDIEIEKFYEIKNKKRKREWLSVRLLLIEMLGEYEYIYYDKLGKPFLKSSQNISITHSNNIVAIILSKKTNPGADIEKKNEKLIRIAEKFMKKKEIDCFSGENRINFILANWSVKEAIYKSQSSKNIDFKENISVLPEKINNKGTLKVDFKKDDCFKQYKIEYLFLEKDYILVWYSGD